MKTQEKMKIMSYVWFITDIIIVICSVLLFIQGGMWNNIAAIIGILLVIFELFLYKSGRLFK